MSTAPRPDNRSSEYQGAARIAAARIHRPATDHNGYPLPGQPAPVFRYGTDQLIESVTEEPSE